MTIKPFRHIVLSAAMLLCAASAWSANSAFSVDVKGRGKPMILIPGLASAGEVWDSTVAHYAGQYQTHVLTLAGFAGQAPTDGDMLDKAEAELAAYIAAGKLDHPVIVGHSLGGFLALRLARDYPDRVGRLVIVDSLPALGATQVPTITADQLKGVAAQMRDAMQRPQDPAARAAGQRQMAASMVSKPEDAERVIGWGNRSDKATVVNAMYDIMATDLRDDVARIKAPTLVLGTWIAYRDYAPREAIEATFAAQYRKLPGVQIAMADKARHFIMYDDPAWMFERMDQFLR